MVRGGGDISLLQCLAGGIKAGCVTDGEIRIVLDQFDRDFCRVPALKDEFGLSVSHQDFIRLHGHAVRMRSIRAATIASSPQHRP
jgi:hypothetical protein